LVLVLAPIVDDQVAARSKRRTDLIEDEYDDEYEDEYDRVAASPPSS
jgi:hypothetical protein